MKFYFVVFILVTSLYGFDFGGALNQMASDVSKNITEPKKVQVKQEPKKVQAKQEDILVSYFESFNKNAKDRTLSKGEINFAGIGSGSSYEGSFREKICALAKKSKSVKEINGYKASDFCKNKPSIISSFPYKKGHIYIDQWKHYYDLSVGDVNVENKEVALNTTGNESSISVEVSSINLQGVPFSVEFVFQKMDDYEVVEGILLDKSIPLTYYSYFQKYKPKNGILDEVPAKWKRYVTRYTLSVIKLIPLDSNAYQLRFDKLKKYYSKKFPNKIGWGVGKVTLDNRMPITYNFDSEVYNNKYRKIFEKDKERKLDSVQDTDI